MPFVTLQGPDRLIHPFRWFSENIFRSNWISGRSLQMTNRKIISSNAYHLQEKVYIISMATIHYTCNPLIFPMLKPARLKKNWTVPTCSLIWQNYICFYNIWWKMLDPQDQSGSVLWNHSRPSVCLSINPCVCPSLIFPNKIESLVFSDSLHDDSWP